MGEEESHRVVSGNFEERTRFPMRDTRKPKSFFDEQLEVRRDPRYAYKLDTDYHERLGESRPVHPVIGLAGMHVQDFLEDINFLYSRGDSLETIKRDVVDEVMDRCMFVCGEIDKYGDDADMHHFYYDVVFPDPQHSVYSILCWLVCLDADAKMMSTLAKYLLPEGLDRLTDTVLHRYDSSRAIGDTCSHPKTFGLLDSLIDAAADKRPAIVASYLKIWGRSMGTLKGCTSLGMGNTKRGIKTNKALVEAIGQSYKGLWAWETALVVKFFDIDDSSFMEHEFYPSDMAAFRRDSTQV